MYERIIEIIVYVLGELKNKKKLSEIDTKELEKLGYTNAEISTAFSWLVDRFEFGNQFFNKDFPSTEDSFRILHQAEQELFTDEAFGELIQYHSLGIINSRHIEAIIERALMLGLYQIDSTQIKSFIAYAIFNAASDLNTPNRYMLSGNDSIN